MDHYEEAVLRALDELIALEEELRRLGLLGGSGSSGSSGSLPLVCGKADTVHSAQYE